jgi:hypothetical protein
MKHKAKRSEVLDAIRDLSKAMKPSAKSLTETDVEKIIQDVRQGAKERKSNGRPARRS